MIQELRDALLSVYEGKTSATTLYFQIKEFEAELKKAKDSILDQAIDEAMGDERYKIVQRTTFNFSHLPEWKEAKANLKRVEEKYKLAYKSMSHGNLSVSEQGEVAELPESKTSTSLQLNK